jgi:hypothetical protein
MFLRLIRNDVKANKISGLVIALFLFFSMTFVISATRLSTNLLISIEEFVKTTKSPHLLQMHSGPIDRERLEKFVKKHPDISAYQISDFVNVEKSVLKINGKASLQDSSQDLGFSSQNQHFDFLLNQNNEIIKPQKGQVYIPLYFYQKGNIKPGDQISIGRLNLTVKGYARDSLMNAGLVSSKRFLIHPDDLNTLKEEKGTSNEFLIAFRLQRLSQISKIETDYQAARLESNGPPIISYSAIKMINGINDALVILVYLLLSLTLIFITLLCMRFALLASIEEDFQQIAIMKVMGLPQAFIKNVYLAKYYACMLLAIILSWLTAHPLTQPALKQMEMSMGKSRIPFYSYLLEITLISILSGLIAWITSHPLKSFKKLTPGQALSSQKSQKQEKTKNPTKKGLPSHRFMDALYFSCKQLCQHKKLYLTMLFILSLIGFVLLLPTNLHRTLTDKEFTQYIGVGKSDIRMDLFQTENIEEKTKQVVKELSQNHEIESFNTQIVYNIAYKDKKGQIRKLRVSVGNHASFPVKYNQGRFPKNDQEIALSKLQANDLKLNLGDSLEMLVNGKKKKMKLVGIYSDLTYGGKTAKATFQVKDQVAISSLVTIQLKESIQKKKILQKLQNNYPDYKITDVNDFFYQTFGDTLARIKEIQLGVFWLGNILVFILTCLFIYMIYIKGRKDLALYRLLGFSKHALICYYLLAFSLVIMVSFLLALILLLSLGQAFCNLLLNNFGISQLQLILDFQQSFLFIPLSILVSGLCATRFVLGGINKLDLAPYLN